MKRYIIHPDEKKAMYEVLSNSLATDDNILFAYVHGSFVSDEHFNDIDVAVYVKNVPALTVEYELNLELQLMKCLGKYIVDVKVLNQAPLSFQYNVIRRGKLLFAIDDDERSEFQEKTVLLYLDFLPYRKRYLQEVCGDII
jgi:predicted nucleotidyltransferase